MEKKLPKDNRWQRTPAKKGDRRKTGGVNKEVCGEKNQCGNKKEGNGIELFQDGRMGTDPAQSRGLARNEDSGRESRCIRKESKSLRVTGGEGRKSAAAVICFHWGRK